MAWRASRVEFRGARFAMIEGHEAMQLFYHTDNKALGPVMIVVGDAQGPDSGPSFKKGDVNVVSWHSHSHAYAIAGTASINYLWNIHNDLIYQFEGI